jgi:hypothetical protein
MNLMDRRPRSTGADVRVLVNHVLKRGRGVIEFETLSDERIKATVYTPGNFNSEALFRAVEVIFKPDGDYQFTSRVNLYGNPVAVDFKTCRWLVRTLSEYQVMEKLGS